MVRWQSTGGCYVNRCSEAASHAMLTPINTVCVTQNGNKASHHMHATHAERFPGATKGANAPLFSRRLFDV